MLAVVKPSPLRLWGFLLTVLGGALMAFGSIGDWAAVSLGGSTENAVPTKGIDLWQGKVTVLIGAISATRLYLGAHYPIDVLGGWIAGAALLSILVAVHVLHVDERAKARERTRAAAAPRRVAVPRRVTPAGSASKASGETVEG